MLMSWLLNHSNCGIPWISLAIHSCTFSWSYNSFPLRLWKILQWFDKLSIMTVHPLWKINNGNNQLLIVWKIWVLNLWHLTWNRQLIHRQSFHLPVKSFSLPATSYIRLAIFLLFLYLGINSHFHFIWSYSLTKGLCL